MENAVPQVQEQLRDKEWKDREGKENSFNVDKANLVFVQAKEASEGKARLGLGPKEKEEISKLKGTKRKATGSFHGCGEPTKTSRKQKDDKVVADVGPGLALGLVPELSTALK